MSQELLWFGTGLFFVGFSPTQNTVVTMFFFQGNRLAMRVGVVATGGSTFEIAVSRSDLANFSKSAERSAAARCGTNASTDNRIKMCLGLITEPRNLHHPAGCRKPKMPANPSW